MSTRRSHPTSAEPPDPLVGRCVQDRYEILEPLGRGGMAMAYLAQDREARQRVVLKVPRSDLAREVALSMQLVERFEREMGAQAALEHAHIVRIRGRGSIDVEGDRLPYLVVDYKDAGDLDQRLRDGPQRLPQVLEWLLPIARALDFSHERDWVHRDVKPDNILFDGQDFVYLSDFGIAKLIQTGLETVPVDPGTGELPPTRLGRVFGTPGYIPPEAISGEHSGAYDQYSLAVVVAQALSGRRPTANGAASNVEPLLSELPRRVSAVLRRALATNPRDRFETCVEFAEALREAGSKRDPKHWLKVAGGAGLVCALGAVVWVVASESGTGEDETGAGSETPSTQGVTRVVAEGGAPFELAGSAPPPTTPEMAIAPSPTRSFELGSTPEEREAALRLCRSHLGEACDPAWYGSEAPRRVELTPFAMDDTEVTVGDFREFIGDLPTSAEENGTHVIVGNASLRVSGPSWHSPGWDPQDDEPVVHVTWDEAAAYCASLGRRLPTEDEWEAFARGASRRVFPWGDEWDANRARWLGSDSVRKPAPVAQFPPAPDGAFDLAGNVWEWTQAAQSLAVDDAEAVLKGGSWAEPNPASLRTATRFVVNRSYSSEDVGFRCVRETEDFRWGG